MAVSSVPLFEAQPNDNNLNGHRELPARLKIQWSKFFNAAGTAPHRSAGAPVRRVAGQPTVLDAHDGAARHRRRHVDLLSQRNLRRGRKMGLPSGQQVAADDGSRAAHQRRAVAEPPDLRAHPHRRQHGGDRRLVVHRPGEFVDENQYLTDLFADPEWGGEAPLWFYILKEAEIVGPGRELGPVGGRIVAEVLVGLLQKDPNSYLTLSPPGSPRRP